MDIKNYTETNRQAWNYVMPKHQKCMKEKWDEFFLKGNKIVQDSTALELLNNIGLRNKDIIHLCCNNGVELLSLKGLGANKCVGVDICDLAISEARERAKKLNMDVEYIRSDVYDIEKEYYQSFDMVYISVGTLRWLPDISKFFKLCNNLLRSNGYIFIYDMHPLTEIVNDDRYVDKDPLLIIKSYFNNDVYSDENGLDYIGHTNEKGKLKYWFIHNLSDIFNEIFKNK